MALFFLLFDPSLLSQHYKLGTVFCALIAIEYVCAQKLSRKHDARADEGTLGYRMNLQAVRWSVSSQSSNSFVGRSS